MARTVVIRIVVDNKDAINAVTKQREEQKKLQEAIRFSREEAERAAKAEVDLANAKNRMTQVQNGLTNSFIKGNLYARAISVGYGAVKDSIGYLITETANLELNFARVNAVAGLSNLQLGELKSNVLALGRDSAVSTNSIAETATELAKLGIQGNELNVVLGGVVKLSSALGDSLELTGQLVGGVVNTFDLAANDAAQVADKLFVATGKSATNITGFRTAFSLTANIAHDAGISFEELSAAIAALSNQGIRASTIGTGLRNFIGELSKEGSKAQKTLGGSIEGLGLLGAMQKLADLKLSSGSLIELFGKPGSPVASGLSHASFEYQKFLSEIKNSGGQLEQSGKIINDTLIGSIQRLKNNFVELFATDELASSFFKSLKSGFSGIAESLKKANEYNENFRAIREAIEEVRKTGNDPQTILGIDPGAFALTDESFADSVAKLKEYRRLQKEANDEYKSAEEERSANRRLANEKRTATTKPGLSTEDQIKALNREFDKFKNELNELETYGHEIDFSDYEKKLGGLSEAFKKLGDNSDSSRVLNEIKRLRAEEAKLNKEPVFKSDTDAIKAVDRDYKNHLKAEEKRQRKRKDEFANFVFEQTEAVDNFNQKLEITKLGMDFLSQSAELFGEKTTEAFLGAESGIHNFGDAFEHIARQFISNLIAMEIRLLAFKALMAILNFGGGPTPAFAPGFDFVPNPLSPTNILPSVAASGYDGTLTRPKLILAGEAGPERVKITPLSKRSAGDGGSGMTIIVQGDVYNAEKFMDKVAQSNERKRTRYV